MVDLNLERGKCCKERKFGHDRILKDYFSQIPTYNDAMFRRCYQMRQHLFLRSVDALWSHDSYFVQKEDAIGGLGLSPIQKIIVAVRILAYGIAADATNAYRRLGESTTMKAMKHFVKIIQEIFEAQYL